jgi:ComF family protein
VLPQRCLLCSAAAEDLALCTACAGDLPLLDPQQCPVCALPTPGAQTCGACLKDPPHFDATRAVYRYDFPLDRLLQSYKYGQRLIVASLFEAALQETPIDGAFDAVIAVPSTPAHLRLRGFNPALELARPLARTLGLPLLLNAVSRPQDAPAQAGLPWKERRKNIRNAFECHTDLSGRRILVVDDVMTTGATLNELARMLKRHGAAHVENRVVARALKE